EAAAALGRDDYRLLAERNAEFLLTELTRDGLLLHVYKDGQAKHVAFHDDYACVAAGLLALYETTGDTRWLRETLALTARMNDEFWDEQEGGFFFTGRSGEQLIVRNKDFFDNATPSGNSVAAELLLRLSHLTGDEGHHRKAVTVLRLLRDALARHPSAFGRLLAALDFYLSKPKEIAVVGTPGSEDFSLLAAEVWRRFLPNKVVALASEADYEARELVPLLRERGTLDGRATAYVCENYTCQQPVSDASELAAQLGG
ncbi:MAG TPA: hypothetical protein VEQ42_00015, partial [Pyrinomonadaceae bacterium]|nr:hypothetical protein [Pyrinomonadaceae bacterium]